MIITRTIGGGLHGCLFADAYQAFLMPSNRQILLNAVGALLGSAASVATYNALRQTQIQKVRGTTSLTMIAMVEEPALYEGLFIDSGFLLPTFLIIGSTFAGVATGVICSNLSNQVTA